jgi:hypothetical protein
MVGCPSWLEPPAVVTTEYWELKGPVKSGTTTIG